MRLARLGSFHQSRLSFMRALLRYLKRTGWTFTRVHWQVDARGVGEAIYRASDGVRAYSLVCYADDLPPEKRTDRVIAERWDATFVLFDGEPSPADIQRLRAHAPRQEAGHYLASELVLARANRSVRMFEYVVDALARGEQPVAEKLSAVGYLMRTTAVYGNGKFGLCDRDPLATRPELAAPFRAELLTVWLIRWFTVDLVEHLAVARGGATACSLHPELRRSLGVGNATGLGMAPFLIHHPALIHHWILARETALARVRAQPTATIATRHQFRQLLTRAQHNVRDWHTADDRQQQRCRRLAQDLARLATHLDARDGEVMKKTAPWDALFRWCQVQLEMEAQELCVSLLIEPHGALVDDLCEQMTVDEARYFVIDGGGEVRALAATIRQHYDWALAIDFTEPTECARFWYVSAEKLEPRLGERFEIEGADKEQPLAYGRDIAALYRDLLAYDPPAAAPTLAPFLGQFPQHRHSVRRVQVTSQLPYAEIRDNLLGAAMLPLDLLRCKLSFFGASRFDPKSDRWVRINLYQYAPHPDEFSQQSTDDWSYPPL